MGPAGLHFKEHYWVDPTLGDIKYVNFGEEVSLDRIKPVLGDS